MSEKYFLSEKYYL